MKKYGKNQMICLAVTALVLTIGASADKTMAYFTTYASASGGGALNLGFTTTELDETFDEAEWTKHVTVQNTGDYDCYVRVSAYTGARYELEYPVSAGWSRQEDGYWYYDQILPAGGETGELLIKINRPENETEEFDVIVVQEHTAVCYREDGTPYADWNLKANPGQEISGGEQR